MAKKAQTAIQPSGQTVASFPEGEEGLDGATLAAADAGKLIADSIREVAIAYRDLTEVLVKIFLKTEAPPKAAPQPKQAPKETPVVEVAPVSTPPAALVATIPAALPATVATAPQQPQIPGTPEQVNQIFGYLRSMRDQVDAAGNHVMVGARYPINGDQGCVMKLAAQMGAEPGVIFGILKYISQLVDTNPKEAVIRLVPPAEDGTPGYMEIVRAS
jgi:hypothetical protein